MRIVDIYKKLGILCIYFGLIFLTIQPVYAIGSNNSDYALNNESQTIQNETKFIKNIEISGNNSISTDYIYSLLDIQAGDEYNVSAVQRNLKNIYSTGYFTERMKAIPVENSDNSITIKIILEENIPVTDFLIEGNSVIPTEELLQFFLPLKGQPQNYAQLNETIEKIQNYYAEKGYILARISSLTDDPDGTLNVVISEGEINKILISGNRKTKDYIIERNILSEPGMVYNENLIKADLVRLYSTQAFKDVNREIEPSKNNPDKYDVTITVDEQRTAQSRSQSPAGKADGAADGPEGREAARDRADRGLGRRRQGRPYQ